MASGMRGYRTVEEMRAGTKSHSCIKKSPAESKGGGRILIKT